MLPVAILLMSLFVMNLGSVAHAENPHTLILVTTNEFQFEPKRWTIPSGQLVNLTIVNGGQKEHEWVLLKKGETVSVPFGDDDEKKVFWEIEVHPKTMTHQTFMAPDNTGTFKVICGKSGHLEKGMEAILVVE